MNMSQIDHLILFRNQWNANIYLHELFAHI